MGWMDALWPGPPGKHDEAKSKRDDLEEAKELLDNMVNSFTIRDLDEEKLMENEYNKMFNLPFSGIGDTYRGQDFAAKQVAPNVYEVHATGRYGGNPFGASSGLAMSHHVTGAVNHVDSQTMRAILDGKHLPNLGLYRMSDEEKEELRELEAEMKQWKKQEELKKFKLLPSHIRQEIVDEALLSDLMGNSEPRNQDFPDWDRVKALREKSDRSLMSNMRFGSTGHDSLMLKYRPILNKFKTEELLEAHAEASLEDEIAD